MTQNMWARDRAYDRHRNVASPDSLPEQHENVARGADIMANNLDRAAEAHEADGNLLYGQAARRMAERHRQLADYHRGEADRRRDAVAGHPSTWTFDNAWEAR